MPFHFNIDDNKRSTSDRFIFNTLTALFAHLGNNCGHARLPFRMRIEHRGLDADAIARCTAVASRMFDRVEIVVNNIGDKCVFLAANSIDLEAWKQKYHPTEIDPGMSNDHRAELDAVVAKASEVALMADKHIHQLTQKLNTAEAAKKELEETNAARMLELVKIKAQLTALEVERTHARNAAKLLFADREKLRTEMSEVRKAHMREMHDLRVEHSSKMAKHEGDWNVLVESSKTFASELEAERARTADALTLMVQREAAYAAAANLTTNTDALRISMDQVLAENADLRKRIDASADLQARYDALSANAVQLLTKMSWQ